MLIHPQDFSYCLDVATTMAENYKRYSVQGAHARKDMNEFVRICREEIGYDIKMKSIPLAASESGIRAFFILMPDTYEIYVLQGLNVCWDAFVRCKELFHILLDKPEYRNMNIYGHLEEVTIAFPNPIAPRPAVVCELLAEIAAMEFLYPYQDRLKDLEKGDPDYLDIARYYRIPQFYVERYLHPDVMRTLGTINHPAITPKPVAAVKSIHAVATA